MIMCKHEKWLMLLEVTTQLYGIQRTSKCLEPLSVGSGQILCLQEPGELIGKR